MHTPFAGSYPLQPLKEALDGSPNLTECRYNLRRRFLRHLKNPKKSGRSKQHILKKEVSIFIATY